jgi:two-component system response regulator
VDIRMPGDDGFSVLKSIRTDAKMTSIPVCMLTTSRHSIDVRRAFTLGANCYLCKSNSFAETKEQIARTLDFWFKQSVLLPPREVA